MGRAQRSRAIDRPAERRPNLFLLVLTFSPTSRTEVRVTAVNVARVLTRDRCTSRKVTTTRYKHNPAKRTRAGSKGRCSRTGPGLSISSISLHPPISPDQLETSSQRQLFTAGNGSTATPRSAPNIAN